MLSGHASHQIGLDADIWLTPMPDRRLTYEEREETSARSVLRENTLQVDPNIWTAAHARLIMRAASYPQVERIFVHPGIKQKLCDSWDGSRANLGKVRPYYGHNYHFHVRLSCPAGARCRSQDATPPGDGCGADLDYWFTDAPYKPAGPPPKKPPKQVMLSDLPPACRNVLEADAIPGTMTMRQAFRGGADGGVAVAAEIMATPAVETPAMIEPARLPRPRPQGR